MNRCMTHGKRIHRTFGAAMSAASACSQKWDKPMRVYYDETCNCWHSSSKFYDWAVAA